MSESKPFFATLPGILSGLAALITAIGGLLFALHQTGLLGTAPAPDTAIDGAGGTAAPANTAAASATASAGAAGGASAGTLATANTTDGWAIIGKVRSGHFFDLQILIDGDSPAIGKRYKVVNDFRFVAKRPQQTVGGQVVTLGMARRGDTVELLDLFVPVPSTETVPVYAKLRAELDSVGN